MQIGHSVYMVYGYICGRISTHGINALRIFVALSAL